MILLRIIITLLALVAVVSSLINEKINAASRVYQVCIALLIEFTIFIILHVHGYDK